jgi:hypothetical protein
LQNGLKGGSEEWRQMQAEIDRDDYKGASNKPAPSQG